MGGRATNECLAGDARRDEVYEMQQRGGGIALGSERQRQRWDGRRWIFVVAGGRKQRDQATDQMRQDRRLANSCSPNTTHHTKKNRAAGSRQRWGKLKRATFTMAWPARHHLIGPRACQGPGAGSSRRTKGPVFPSPALSVPSCLCPSPLPLSLPAARFPTSQGPQPPLPRPKPGHVWDCGSCATIRPPAPNTPPVLGSGP